MPLCNRPTSGCFRKGNCSFRYPYSRAAVSTPPGDAYCRILIEESPAEIPEKLKKVTALIDKGDLRPWESAGLKVI